MDVLTDLLQRSRARGAHFSRSAYDGAWGVDFPGSAGLAVHAAVAGEMHAWLDDPREAQLMRGGDVVLVRAHRRHHLAHAPGAACRPFDRHPDREPPAAPTAVFFCGAYLFEGDLFTPLLRSLPDFLRVRPQPGSALRVTIDLLVAEMDAAGPGQQALLDRLLDVALVQVLREHLAERGAGVPGWVAAARDPALAAALEAVHADPAHPWTVAELAARAHVSRAVFARRFTEATGVPPLQYVTDWRMALARERLRDTGDALAAIAASVGYASEFSFAAAFKRHVGVAPGRWRAAQRAAVAA